MQNVITNRNGQLVSCSGPEAVRAFQFRVLIGALKLETKGIRVTRGYSALKAAKAITGLKSRDRAAHIAKLEELMAEQIAKCEVVTEAVAS
jgi:hypothetical protein